MRDAPTVQPYRTATAASAITAVVTILLCVTSPANSAASSAVTALIIAMFAHSEHHCSATLPAIYFFALRHRDDEPFVDHHKKKPCLSVVVQLENVNRRPKTADGHMVQDTISAPIPQAENAGNTSIRGAIRLFLPFRLKKKNRGDFSLKFKSLYSAGFPTQSACLRAPRLVQ